MAIVWKNGEFGEDADFRISPFDRGLCHGLSLFETVLAVDGEPRLLEEHEERLRAGFVKLGVDVEIPGADELRRVMVELLERNGLSKGLARIRYAVSLGEGGLDELGGGRSWAWMTASGVIADGKALRVMKALKGRGVLDGLKTGNYAGQIVSLDRARRSGYDEVLFFDERGELCEAAMANVFLIKDDSLMTPGLDSGCLAGIARGWVMGAFDAEEGNLLESDVREAEGIFLTSSVKGPVWVGEFDRQMYERHPLFDEVRRRWDEAMGC